MNRYDVARQNIKSSLRIYRETREILAERIEGETGIHVKLNSQCVLDGLSKMIMLEERKLNEYTEEVKASEETE